MVEAFHTHIDNRDHNSGLSEGFDFVIMGPVAYPAPAPYPVSFYQVPQTGQGYPSPVVYQSQSYGYPSPPAQAYPVPSQEYGNPVYASPYVNSNPYTGSGEVVEETSLLPKQLSLLKCSICQQHSKLVDQRQTSIP